MIKLDLHMHSWFSFDSLNDPDKMALTVRKKGLDGFAVTDHNVLQVDFEGLQKKNKDLIIIPGIEIWTEIGDILIYFPWKIGNVSHNTREILENAKKHGSIAVLAHPYTRRNEEYPDEIIEMLDGIETDNSHNYANHNRCLQLARKSGKPCFGGSDAHFLHEIGNGTTSVDIDRENAFDKDAFKKAILKTASPSSVQSSDISFYGSQFIKYARKLKILSRK